MSDSGCRAARSPPTAVAQVRVLSDGVQWLALLNGDRLLLVHPIAW